MKKSIKKSLLVILIITAVLMTFSFAFATPDGNVINVKDIKPSDVTKDPTNAGMINLTKKILELLQLIAIAVGLVMLIVIGIRSILNAGGKDRPDIKKVAIDYVFGAICIFGATGILTFIQQLVAQFQNNL